METPVYSILPAKTHEKSLKFMENRVYVTTSEKLLKIGFNYSFNNQHRKCGI